MGCITSKTDINDLHPNIFEVMNVDDSMQPRGPGQIEITDTELILHQRGKPATNWPLRGLRKYGFDSEIFTFEAGRRCTTGAGIYAFRCKRADQMFNLLQHNIQVRNSLEDNNVERRPEGYLQPNTTNRPSLSRPGSITSNGPISPVSLTTPVVLEHNNNKRASLEHSYLNTNLSEDPNLDNTAVPYVNITTPHNIPEESHVYMNVNAGEATPAENEHNYANVNTSDLPAPPLTPNSLPTTPTSLYVTIREVNYAELDLDSSATSNGAATMMPATVPDSPHKGKSYVTIDFNKTNALQQSVNPRLDLEETGSRKTRHNSTFGDGGVRHSSSVSD